MDWISPSQHYNQSQFSPLKFASSPSSSMSFPPPSPDSTPRKKRTAADASLTITDPHSRLTKRLETLTLRNGLPRKPRILYRRPSAEPEEEDPFYIPPPPAAPSERMDLDNSIDTIYISDLDAAALSDSDAALDDDEELTDEEKGRMKGKLIFVPDIEREMTRIPLVVLKAQSESERLREREGKELVLYGVPKSLSVEEERDGVRRAVEEARERFRRKMRGESNEVSGGRRGLLALEAPPGMMEQHQQEEEGRGEVDADGDVDMDM